MDVDRTWEDTAFYRVVLSTLNERLFAPTPQQLDQALLRLRRLAPECFTLDHADVGATRVQELSPSVLRALYRVCSVVNGEVATPSSRQRPASLSGSADDSIGDAITLPLPPSGPTADGVRRRVARRRGEGSP